MRAHHAVFLGHTSQRSARVAAGRALLGPEQATSAGVNAAGNALPACAGCERLSRAELL